MSTGGDEYEDLLSSLAGTTQGEGNQQQTTSSISSYRYPANITSNPSTSGSQQTTSSNQQSNTSVPISYSHSLMQSSNATNTSSQPSSTSSTTHQRTSSTQSQSGSVASPPPQRLSSPAAASPRGASASHQQTSSVDISRPGPLPDAAAGVRSFVEFGSEESDVEFVQNQLDYHWSKCKEEVMTRLVARQARLEDEARRLKEFRTSYVNHVNALQDEIEKLKELNLKKDKDLERMHSQQEKMVESWTIQHNNVLRQRYQSMAWAVWRRTFLEEQTLKRISVKFVHPHYRKKLLLQVISQWRSQARTSKRVADEAYWRGQIQETTAQLIQDYEKNLSELRHQLAQAEDVIRYHHEDQTAVEEKLKQAFIRGVCALNREALSVFTAPGDVAEANIRSHFAQPAVGQGAFMHAAASAIAANNAAVSGTGGVPPPPTNPSAFSSGSSHMGSASASPPATSPAGLTATGGPSAPLPSQFVGGAPQGSGLSSSVPRTAGHTSSHHPTSNVASGRPGGQIPYPAHSHHSVRPHTQHPHPHPHPQPRAGATGLHGMTQPQPRQQGPPKPYGK